VRFAVHTVMLMKIQVLWDMMPYELVVTDISVELSVFLFRVQASQKTLKIRAASS